jgi:hypothetical protein
MQSEKSRVHGTLPQTLGDLADFTEPRKAEPAGPSWTLLCASAFLQHQEDRAANPEEGPLHCNRLSVPPATIANAEGALVSETG